jgi:hypothetical protein
MISYILKNKTFLKNNSFSFFNFNSFYNLFDILVLNFRLPKLKLIKKLNKKIEKLIFIQNKFIFFDN